MALPMFWIMVVGSMVIVGSIMGLLAYLARETPVRAKTSAPHRMNPELIRMLAYALMLLICLLAAIYELHLNYSDLGD